MPTYRLDLTISEWEGEDPLDCVNSFLDTSNPPWWDQLEWTITDRATGMTFEVLPNGPEGPEVYLSTVNGERVLLDRVGREND